MLKRKPRAKHWCDSIGAVRRLQLYLEQFRPGELGAGESAVDAAIRLLVEERDKLPFFLSELERLEERDKLPFFLSELERLMLIEALTVQVRFVRSCVNEGADCKLPMKEMRAELARVEALLARIEALK